MADYIKVLGIMETEDALLTEIVEEVHRGNIDEAFEFIRERPHRNTTWIIKTITM